MLPICCVISCLFCPGVQKSWLAELSFTYLLKLGLCQQSVKFIDLKSLQLLTTLTQCLKDNVCSQLKLFTFHHFSMKNLLQQFFSFYVFFNLLIPISLLFHLLNVYKHKVEEKKKCDPGKAPGMHLLQNHSKGISQRT